MSEVKNKAAFLMFIMNILVTKYFNKDILFLVTIILGLPPLSLYLFNQDLAYFHISDLLLGIFTTLTCLYVLVLFVRARNRESKQEKRH